MKKMIKSSKDNGITLISLVITMLVLVIVAAISIVALTGDNSIVMKTTDAKIQAILARIGRGSKFNIFPKNWKQL